SRPPDSYVRTLVDRQREMACTTGGRNARRADRSGRGRTAELQPERDQPDHEEQLGTARYAMERGRPGAGPRVAQPLQRPLHGTQASMAISVASRLCADVSARHDQRALLSLSALSRQKTSLQIPALPEGAISNDNDQRSHSHRADLRRRLLGAGFCDDALDLRFDKA